MAKSHDLSDTLQRLATAEERFLAGEFLAPVIRGGKVQVRIAGILCALRVRPAEFEGWGVFRPASHSDAELVRPAKLGERRRYLELFPLVRLILADRGTEEWLALPAHRSDSRFQMDGVVPVRLVEEGQLFEVIETRFDGSQFWYAGSEERGDPARANYLRQQLAQLTPPERLHRSGLTAEEQAAYALNYWPRFAASEEAQRSREECRLRSALEHAGAELKGYVERRDVYTIAYEVDGQRHVSAVAKKDLSVQVAGICLSGEDDKFDLQSLVGVIRVPIAGTDPRKESLHSEEHYW